MLRAIIYPSSGTLVCVLQFVV